MHINEHLAIMRTDYKNPSFIFATSLLIYVCGTLVIPQFDAPKLGLIIPLAYFFTASIESRKKYPIFSFTKAQIFLFISIGYLCLSSFILGYEAGDLENWELLRDGALIIIFLLIIHVAKSQLLSSPYTIANIIFASVLISCILLIYNYAGSNTGTRLSGDGVLENPNQTATIPLVVYAFGLFLYKSNSFNNAKQTTLIISTFILLGVLIFLTGSRGGMFAYFLLLVAMSITTPWARVLLILLILTITIIMMDHLLTKASIVPEPFNTSIHKLISRGDSLRLIIWKASILNPPENLFFGYGIEKDFSMSAAGGYIYEKTNGKLIAHTHNLFIEFYYRSGIIGLLLFLTINAIIIKKIFETEFINYKLGLIYVYCTFLAVNFFDTARLITHAKEDWFLLWLPIGILITAPVAPIGTHQTQCKH